MLDSLVNLQKNLSRLNTNKIFRAVWSNTLVQDYIINLNTEQQLRKGINSDGDQVGEYRNDAYAAAKQLLPGREAAEGVVDLVVTGTFYSTFDIKVTNKGFSINANTNLYDFDFINRYGESIIGLTQENQHKLVTFIFPFFIEELKEQIFNGV